MGNSRWSADDWTRYADATINNKGINEVFKARFADDDLNPAKFAFRESRDSAANPMSTPILIGADVTGSMGHVAHTLLSTGINTIATEIYGRKPVSDPHIAIMAIGDAKSDRAPIQATQFEADIGLADQVSKLWLEGNGGGNGGESYSLAHLFAALKTRTDAQEKRKRKGYLFTIGDEPIHDGVSGARISRFLGISKASDMNARTCLFLATEGWDIFHIVLANEGYSSYALDEVLSTWKPLLPERTILLEDTSLLAQTIVSAIEVNEGRDAAEVARSWDGGTSVVIANAMRSMVTKGGRGRATTGPRRLAP